MGWRDWFRNTQPHLDGPMRLARSAALGTLKQSKFPNSMEGNQFALAQLWTEMVLRHYTEIAHLAESENISIDRVIAARLLRQVCSFYNVLWWYRLHQRILDTGRIAQDDIPGYMESFKEATRVTLVMHPDIPIRPDDMPIFTHPNEMQWDHDFYTNGSLPNAAEEEDFSIVLKSISQQRDGTFAEIIARLHFRTIQVLDLSHKLGLMQMQLWWGLQLEMVEQNMSLILNKLIPVPN